MDTIRIQDMADGGLYDVKDKFALQRQEAGVWNDYHTTMEAYYGPFRTVEYEHDLSLGPFTVNIASPIGSKLLVPLIATMTYEPPPIFPAAIGVQVEINQGVSGVIWYAGFNDDSVAKAMIFREQPLVAPPWTGLTNSIEVTSGTSGSEGIIRIRILVADIDPIP